VIFQKGKLKKLNKIEKISMKEDGMLSQRIHKHLDEYSNNSRSHDRAIQEN